MSAARWYGAALVPVVAACAVYLPALRNGFIWDDPLVLQQLRAIHSLGDLLVPPAIIPHYYFRPLIFLSYLVDRAFGGDTPFWFHASVVAFHALNTLLVFVVGSRLFAGDGLIAGGGALLFAVFPTHVESVAWMAGRSDVIVCTFVLLTVLLFMDRARRWSPWLGGVTLLLATLSKEMALACVVLVPLLDLLRTRQLYWSRYVPLALAALLYFILRQHALGAFVGGMPAASTPAQLGLDLVRALGFYVVRAVVPIGLCAYIPDVPDHAAYVAAGLIVPVLSLATIAMAWRRSRWEVAFLVAFFFLTLAPSLTVIVRRSASAVVADRYLYVPSVASCLLMAWAIARLAPRWPVALLILLAAVYTARTLPYARVWADDLTFWTDVATKVPGDALPNLELANALQDREQLPEAERALQRALAGKAYPEARVMAYNNLGILYRRMGRYDESLKAFADGVRIRPHPSLYHNLGMTLIARIEQEQRGGDQDAVTADIVKARAAFEQALKLGTLPAPTQASPIIGFPQWDPAKTHNLLGQVLFSLGDRAGAREHLETALRLNPSGPVADATRLYMQRLKD